MPIPSDQFSVLEDGLNRLATETILAQAGRDEGLVPAYSLLGELRDICSMEPPVREAIASRQTRLEQLLDAAQPFDAATLEDLRRLVEWLPGAINSVRAGQAVLPMPEGRSAAAGPAEVPVPASNESTDELLVLNLGENRDLLVEFHAETVDHLQQIEAALLTLDQQPDDPEAVNAIFRSFHTIKGNAGFLGLVPMQLLAHEVESLLDLARNQKLRLHPAIVTEILRSRDALVTLAQQVGTALESGELPQAVVPVAHLVRAVKLLAATPAEAFASQPHPAPPPAVVEEFPIEPAPPAEPVEVAAPVASSGATAGGARNPNALQTVRVSTEKLDSLMDVVGELVIVQSQILETARAREQTNSALQLNVAQLARIAKDLQRTTMSLRMIPIKSTFQKMERLARDLARDFGKKVAFHTEGEDTELDRTVVEEIGDPLVHMVRNALDHGLEAPADRTAAGKPEAGQLRLRAYHQGGNIVVELTDDGRGLDPERILAKARRQQLIPDGAQLTREEIFNLIFLPGFSTAEKVTAVSGRGVGMDVVKRNIEKLRGKIEISSEIGKGSTFKIKLPLTMAIIDGLVVRVGTDKFILPSTSVQMAMRPPKDSITTVHGTGEVLELRGKILPLHRLHRRFGIPADATQPWEGIVVIVEHSGRVSALLVDEMVSKQEVVIKNLGAFMQGLPGVAGGAILGDGNIALILDPASLLQAAA